MREMQVLTGREGLTKLRACMQAPSIDTLGLVKILSFNFKLRETPPVIRARGENLQNSFEGLSRRVLLMRPTDSSTGSMTHIHGLGLRVEKAAGLHLFGRARSPYVRPRPSIVTVRERRQNQWPQLPLLGQLSLRRAKSPKCAYRRGWL